MRPDSYRVGAFLTSAALVTIVLCFTLYSIAFLSPGVVVLVALAWIFAAGWVGWSAIQADLVERAWIRKAETDAYLQEAFR